MVDDYSRQIAYHIRINAIKLMHLVDCTLDVSQLKAGKFIPKESKCNIMKVL